MIQYSMNVKKSFICPQKFVVNRRNIKSLIVHYRKYHLLVYGTLYNYRELWLLKSLLHVLNALALMLVLSKFPVL